MRRRSLLTIPAALAALPAWHAAYAVQYMSIDEAKREAFPDASGFEDVAVDRAALDAARAKLPESALGADWSPRVWRAKKEGVAIGTLIADRVIGKSELIDYAVAFGSDGAILAVDVLEYRETHGQEIHLPMWRRQFDGKSARDPIRLDQDIRNISGATLSCRHVTDGVRRLVELYATALAAKA